MTEERTYLRSTQDRVSDELENVRRLVTGEFSASRLAGVHGLPVGTSGKLLRPQVLFLCALHASRNSAATDWDSARRAALAIEIAHVGTLYHDDIVDRSDIRRESPSTHRKWGVRVASVGGAHLLVHANALFAALPDPLPVWWGRTSLDVSAGQLQEMETAGDLSVSVTSYIAMARRKTGALFELAAKCGAWCGGARNVNAFGEIGSHLGTAYQLCDDLLDFVQFDPRARPSATDLRNRFYSLPIQLAARSGTPEGQELTGILEDDGRPLPLERSRRVVELAISAGGFHKAERIAASERQEFLKAIDRLPASGPLSNLTHLMDTFFQTTLPCVRSSAKE